MRILHSIASINPATGGPARSVPQLLMALKDAGLEVALWTAEITQSEWQRPLQERGISVFNGDLADLPAFNLIHDHGLWLMSNRQVASYARAKGIPRIVSPRGMLEPWSLNHKKWKKRAAWWTYQRRDLKSAAALHATANSEADQFKCLGLHQAVHVIPNGVEIMEDEGRGTKGGARELLADSLAAPRSPASDLKTALFLSRIHPKKGLPMLVEAWAKVRPQGWRMRVVGPDEGGHRAEVEAMVAKVGLENEWTFEGAHDDEAKWQCYRAADLFILPTYSENFGICIAEALATGTPVITTTGTPWQGLQERQCGWWVEPTVAGLSAALVKATSLNAPDRAAMGFRGQTWVTDEFTWSGIAARMSEAYGQILTTPTGINICSENNISRNQGGLP
jgi:glycosyltransferase involved in cell wall biosynthesis